MCTRSSGYPKQPKTGVLHACLLIRTRTRIPRIINGFQPQYIYFLLKWDSIFDVGDRFKTCQPLFLPESVTFAFVFVFGFVFVFVLYDVESPFKTFQPECICQNQWAVDLHIYNIQKFWDPIPQHPSISLNLGTEQICLKDKGAFKEKKNVQIQSFLTLRS